MLCQEALGLFIDVCLVVLAVLIRLRSFIFLLGMEDEMDLVVFA